jgi:hypothetical protein
LAGFPAECHEFARVLSGAYMTLSQSGHRIITVFGCSFAIFSITLASCSWCFARSGRLRRRAFFAHCKCCRGFIRNGSGGSSIIGIYPSLTVSSPCCTHWALHRRCNVGAFRTPVTLADARRCRPIQLSFLHKAHSCDRRHIASAMAELVSCLSIIPHTRSFDVPPKLSPAQRGAFFAPPDSRGGTRSGASRCARRSMTRASCSW